MKLLNSKANPVIIRFRCALTPWHACSLRSISRHCLTPSSGSNGDSNKVDAGSGGFDGGGNKGNYDGRRDGSEHDAPPPSRQPLWLQILLCITFIVYIFVRIQWRRDLQGKMDQREREEEVMEREEQAWNSFLQEQEIDSSKRKG